MIKVKKELLESFYEQSVKEMKLEDTQFPYKLFIKLVDEFKDENLELFNTLKDTINAIVPKIQEELKDRLDYFKAS
jgi:hypothetical protein